MTQIDTEGIFSSKVRQLSEAVICCDAWEGIRYSPNHINRADRVVSLAEEIALEVEELLAARQMIRKKNRYLETHVNEVLP